MMQGLFKFGGWLLACFFLAGIVHGADGVWIVDLEDARNRETLAEAGEVVLWATDRWALVATGQIPGSRLLLSDVEDEAVYLAYRAPWIGDEVFGTGRSVEIESGIRLVAGDAAALLGRGAQGIEWIRLGAPFVFPHEPRSGAPSRVDWKQQVQDMVDDVTWSELLVDLSYLVDFQTRYSYATGCVLAGDYLEGEFQALGLSTSRPGHTSGMPPNVVGELVGQVTPEEIVIVCGHYDSISPDPYNLAPGADDNGTGTVAVLQAAKRLSDSTFERTIRFIGFSGEEQGLLGSQQYAADAAAAGDQIVGVINQDMVGWVDAAPEDLECIGNIASEPLVDHFIECAGLYTSLPTNKLIDGSITPSDHSPFWNQGYQAFLGIEDYWPTYPYYHTVDDTVDKVDPTFFTQVTRATVASVAELALPISAGSPTPSPTGPTATPTPTRTPTPTPSATYCPADGGCDEYIERVELNAIDNTSACEGYGDFTAQSTDLEIGTGYPITVTVGNAYSADAVTAWVDWNQDLDFADAGEEFVLSWSEPTASGTITPPAGAISGTTRMRIRLVWNGVPSPCGTTAYGEVEDYTVNVISSSPSETPTHTPTRTPTTVPPTVTPTHTPTRTPTTVPPTVTPTHTPTRTPTTVPPTVTPTRTPTLSPTSMPPTETPTPTSGPPPVPSTGTAGLALLLGAMGLVLIRKRSAL